MLSSRPEATPEHTPGNAPARGQDRALQLPPQRGMTSVHPRAEPGAAPCLRRLLTNSANPGGFAQMNLNTANPVERTGSHLKRTSQRAEGRSGQQRIGTLNPETLTPHGATTEEARRTRTLLTAGGAAGRRTNSESITSPQIHLSNVDKPQTNA